jgi:ABC-type multidrug transport system fused ATPase/permease subunit
MFTRAQRIWNSLFFGSVTDTMRRGGRVFLQEADMPPLPAHLNPASFDVAQYPLNVDSPWKFVVALAKSFRKRFFIAFGLVTLQSLFLLATPALVFQLITVVREALSSDVSWAVALGTALAMAALPVFFQVTLQQYFYAVLNLYQCLGNVLNKHIYSHALKISQAERAKTPVGDIVNHMSNDADAISDIAMVLADLYSTTLVVLGGSALLFYFAGWSAFVGVGVVFVVSPVMRFVAPRMVKFGDQVMMHCDARVSTIAQVLRGIRIVKYFCWTRGVESEVGAIRSRELSARLRMVVAESVANLGFSSIPVLMALGIFGTRILAGQGLDPAMAFSCLSALAIMKDPIGNVAHQLGYLLQIRVSAARLIQFFATPTQEGVNSASFRATEAASVQIKDLAVRYDKSNAFALKNIDLDIRAGECVALVGPVASGKSTLLLALLNEVPVVGGSVLWGNSGTKRPALAWVPQEAFIINATVRENILLGASETGLEGAIAQAMLTEDVRALPGGLNTEIGDHGVNLSGGQKQRVSLARAAMQNASVVLLDDPLSAVDHHTEEGIVDRLFFGRWAQTTRLVATHRLAHLSRFDTVVFMMEGRIVAKGTYRELLANSHEFRAFVAERAGIEEREEKATSSDKQALAHADLPSVGVYSSRVSSELLEPSTQVSSENDTASVSRVTEDEERATGAVGVGVYWGYLRYFAGEGGGARLAILFLFVFGLIATTALPMLQDAWLALWLNQAERAEPNFLAKLLAVPRLASDSWLGIGVYALIGVGIILTHFEHLIFSRWRALQAGKRIHELAFGAVLRAPIRFFDATPMGRILNRFSRDILVADQQLASSMPDFIWCLTKVLVTMLFIVFVVPQTFFVMIPVFYFYYRIQKIYRASAREVKRFTSISASPRFSHFKETLEGLAVIRAFDRQEFFTNHFVSRLSRYQAMFHAMYLMNRWFSSRIPLLSGSITLAVTLALVVWARSGQILPATAGLVLGFVLNSTGNLNWAVRAFSDLESQMTGVQRLLHFAKIEPEPDVSGNQFPLSAAVSWPTKGEIEFDGVEARYAKHLPLVLKGFSARVPGGKRVALVGRTGSGKSTVFQALFRFVEITKGEIRIDGVNIASIPLERLRGAIAVIPQDPVLFIGSLRRNLDYFGHHAEEAIWNALQRVHLADYVQSLPGKLESQVLENGSNLSQGQRQLVCLARAFLDKSRIIVMDEATASVDVQTDALIQRTIREECEGLTVLVIAHRLGTVSDCDFTIHLDDGKALA